MLLPCRTCTLYLCALLPLFSVALPVTAQDLADSSFAAEIDALVAPYVAAGDFSGVVGVQRDGEAPLMRPYGLASVELDVPHQATDAFMIGSVSKQFTAVALLLLEEEGLLRTEDLVREYLPAFPHGAQITIEQLLTHTSGVVDIYSLQRFGETGGHSGTFEEVIQALGQTALTHTPGAAFAYSNGGYALLAAIIEQVSGVSYGTYLESRLFAPLGMTDTAHDRPGSASTNRVPGYDPWGAYGLTPTKPISEAYLIGSGSLWSSASDLLRWAEALHTGRILGDAAYDKLTHDYGYSYGYGVSVFRRFGRAVVGHDGRVAGYASDLARYLDDRVTVVILSNVQSVARDEIRRLVAGAVFGESYTIPPPRILAGESVSALSEFVGTYAFGPGFEVSVTAPDGRLLARANEGGYSELVPMGDAVWFSRMLYTAVRFGQDEEGTVDRLIWGLEAEAPVGHRIQ